jgi:hypothetical protein
MSLDKPILTRIPFRSQSKPENSYETIVYTDLSTSCNCRGWCIAKNGIRECRHTIQVEESIRSGLLQLDPQKIAWSEVSRKMQEAKNVLTGGVAPSIPNAVPARKSRKPSGPAPIRKFDLTEG